MRSLFLEIRLIHSSYAILVPWNSIHRFYWSIHRTRFLLLEIMILFLFIFARDSWSLKSWFYFVHLCSLFLFIAPIASYRESKIFIDPVFIDDLDWSVQLLKLLILLFWNLNVIDYWAREPPVRTLGGIGPSVSLLQGFPNVGQFHDCLEVGFFLGTGTWHVVDRAHWSPRSVEGWEQNIGGIRIDILLK